MIQVYLWICLAGLVTSQAVDDQQEIKLSMYFSSLCPDSIAFFTNEFAPFWKDHRDEFKLTYKFNPYGKTRISDDPEPVIRCQHGPQECVGNQLIACGMEDFEDQTELIEFIVCVMTSFDITDAQEKCYRKQVSDEDRRKKFEACNHPDNRKKVFEGLKKDVETLEPPLRYIPRIDINGEYKPEAEIDLYEQLKAVKTRSKKEKASISEEKSEHPE